MPSQCKMQGKGEATEQRNAYTRQFRKNNKTYCTATVGPICRRGNPRRSEILLFPDMTVPDFAV